MNPAFQSPNSVASPIISGTSRRNFLRQTVAGAACAALSGSSLRRADATLAPGGAFPVPVCDVRIERLVGLAITLKRPRIVAGNSQYRLAGDTRTETFTAAFGNNGKVGVGAALDADPKTLVGKTVRDILGKAAASHRGRGTSAFWDLAAWSEGKPLYQLLGGRVPEGGVPVYDGSIYMEELLSHYPGQERGRTDDWKAPFLRALDITRQSGHTFIKVKIGRGALHLARQAGNLQDVAVLEFLRSELGPEFGIGIDANNGYTLEDTKWLLRETAGLDLAFIEEMFREDLKLYHELDDFIRAHGFKPVIADGENWAEPDNPSARPFIESGLIRILQGDILRFGIEGIAREAELGRAHGCRVAPHNWGTLPGFLLQVHLGCAIPEFYRAEQDMLTPQDDLLAIEPYTVRNGRCTPPDAPGLGVQLTPSALERAKLVFDGRA